MHSNIYNYTWIIFLTLIRFSTGWKRFWMDERFSHKVAGFGEFWIQIIRAFLLLLTQKTLALHKWARSIVIGASLKQNKKMSPLFLLVFFAFHFGNIWNLSGWVERVFSVYAAAKIVTDTLLLEINRAFLQIIVFWQITSFTIL